VRLRTPYCVVNPSWRPAEHIVLGSRWMMVITRVLPVNDYYSVLYGTTYVDCTEYPTSGSFNRGERSAKPQLCLSLSPLLHRVRSFFATPPLHSLLVVVLGVAEADSTHPPSFNLTRPVLVQPLLPSMCQKSHPFPGSVVTL
jgi:hypothetical protein